ncbi:MAG TPA: ATP-binding protein [Longimicrobiaceae bacterium]|nr:ATP-binding protein [Longimicrobiaceae bacterium]
MQERPDDRSEVKPWAGLLGVPLFYKILLANAVLVLLVAGVSATLAVSFLDAAGGRSTFGLFVLIAVAGAVATVPIYAVILRFALAPLGVLERTAERVEAGDQDARATLSPLADPEVARLTAVFNRLLDSVAADRMRLQEVAARAFQAQEAERLRLANELQEETAQSLSALLLQLRIVQKTDDAPARNAALTVLREDVAAVTERIRRFARGLHAPALAELGLVPAVEGYSRTLAEETGLQISVSADDLRGALSAEGTIALFRIIQEALSNVVRHASATNVQVELRRAQGLVEVVVRDDGRGFAVAETAEEHQNLGLFGMQERALYAGGSATIESEPGSGTVVRARIPLAGGSSK